MSPTKKRYFRSFCLAVFYPLVHFSRFVFGDDFFWWWVAFAVVVLIVFAGLWWALRPKEFDGE